MNPKWLFLRVLPIINHYHLYIPLPPFFSSPPFLLPSFTLLFLSSQPFLPSCPLVSSSSPLTLLFSCFSPFPSLSFCLFSSLAFPSYMFLLLKAPPPSTLSFPPSFLLYNSNIPIFFNPFIVPYILPLNSSLSPYLTLLFPLHYIFLPPFVYPSPFFCLTQLLCHLHPLSPLSPSSFLLPLPPPVSVKIVQYCLSASVIS